MTSLSILPGADVPPAAVAKPGAPRSRREEAWIITLAFLAPLLGGTTQVWSKGLLFVLIGALLLGCPARKLPPAGLLWYTSALLLLGVAAFLPASWFSFPAWRTELQKVGVVFPATLTPQPWLTGEAWLALLGGVGWLGWLSARDWSSLERHSLAKSFAAGVIGLAALFLLCWFQPVVTPPIWHSVSGFGPFPNRNQTAGFLALGAPLVLACLHRSYYAGSRGWLLWLAGFGLLACSLVVNGSRAGIALLIGDCSLWLMFLWWCAGRSSRLALAASSMLALTSLFSLAGGETAHRFYREFTAEGGGWLGFRGRIYQDAWHMMLAGPWCGTGLGNFRAVFPFYRVVARTEVTTLHPESDWLWAGTELGWPGLLLLMAGAVWLLAGAFPFSPGSDRQFRAAAWVAMLGFLVHGLVDVSGHRLGSVLPALFVSTLARKSSLQRTASHLGLWLSRLVGGGIVAAGSLWLLSSTLGWPLPGAAGVELAETEMSQGVAERKFDTAIAAGRRAIHYAPLDGQLHFALAAAEGAKGDWLGSMAEFRIARALQPAFTERALAEGRIWVALNPPLALTPWREALTRAPAEHRTDVFRRILSDAARAPGLLPALRPLTEGSPSRQAAWLAQADQAEAPEALRSLLAGDPELARLDAAEKRAIFAVWLRFGDATEWANQCARRADWLRAGWPLLARRAAVSGDPETAVRIALTYLTPPALPFASAASAASAEDLLRRTLLHPDDYAGAWLLYCRQRSDNESSSALATLLRATAQPGSPLYFRYVEACERARGGDYAGAWQALEVLLQARPDRDQP